MLGRIKKTSRIDVGLALAFAGLAYLVWALVAGISRQLVQEFIRTASVTHLSLPVLTQRVKIFFVDAGFVIDIVGLCWLLASLVLVLQASRQKISVSWAWVSAICQGFIAALGAVLVGWAAFAPHLTGQQPAGNNTSLETVSSISLPTATALAILIWVVMLVWLLVERARLNRRGPTLTDGLRSNVFKN